MIDPASSRDRRALFEVPLAARSSAVLSAHNGREAELRLDETQERARDLMADRTFWNINSTAGGGGLA